jgi:hypothetical protein
MNRRAFFPALAAVLAAPSILAKLRPARALTYEEMPLGLIEVGLWNTSTVSSGPPLTLASLKAARRRIQSDTQLPADASLEWYRLQQRCNETHRDYYRSLGS